MKKEKALSSGFRQQAHVRCIPTRVSRDPEDFEIRRIIPQIQTFGFAVERAIRPFVIGRSNWLFADTPRGAHASAALYSLVETAKANGLEPYHYFRYLFTHLPAASSNEDFKKLLPLHLNATDLLDL